MNANQSATMYESIPVVSELNKVQGFDPLKFLRRTSKGERKLDLKYKKLWFRLKYAASKAHPKSAIQIRNREMVDRADLVLCAIERQSGGAWQTIQYAMKQEKPVINLFDEPDE